MKLGYGGNRVGLQLPACNAAGLQLPACTAAVPQRPACPALARWRRPGAARARTATAARTRTAAGKRPRGSGRRPGTAPRRRRRRRCGRSRAAVRAVDRLDSPSPLRRALPSVPRPAAPVRPLGSSSWPAGIPLCRGAGVTTEGGSARPSPGHVWPPAGPRAPSRQSWPEGSFPAPSQLLSLEEGQGCLSGIILYALTCA